MRNGHAVTQWQSFRKQSVETMVTVTSYTIANISVKLLMVCFVTGIRIPNSDAQHSILNFLNFGQLM